LLASQILYVARYTYDVLAQTMQSYHVGLQDAQIMHGITPKQCKATCWPTRCSNHAWNHRDPRHG